MGAPGRARFSGTVLFVLALARPAAAHEPSPEPTDATPAPPASRRYRTLVTGRARATASERRVEAKTIQAIPRRSGDDLLRLVPGLLITRHGGEGKATQIFLRGFDAEHGSDVEVLLGGVPLNEWSNVHGQGYLDLGAVIPEAVLGLTALKGSFELSQGNFATAGSVRLQLGVPEDLRGYRIGYETGSFNRHRLVAVIAPRRAPEETFAAFEAMRDDGYGQNRASERLAFVGQARLWSREHAGRLEAMALGYAARFGESGAVPLGSVESGRLGFFDTFARSQRGESSRALAALRYRLDHHQDNVEALVWGAWRRLSLAENFTGYLVHSEKGDTRRQFHRSIQGGARLRYTRRLPHGLALVAGADLLSESGSQFEDGLDDAKQPFRRDRDLDFMQHAADAHVGLRFRYRDRIRLEGGARVDLFHLDATDRQSPERSGRATLVTASPRLATAFELPAGFSLFAAYGRGLRAPEARAVTNLSGSRPDIDLSQFRGGPVALTTSDAFEGGARFRYKNLVELGAAGYGTFIEREVIFDHVSGINVALGATRRLGVEVEARVQPLRWLELRGDFTYVDARFADSRDPVPGVPNTLATLQATILDLHGLFAGARFLYLGPRPLAFGAVAAGLAQLDLSLGYRAGFLQVDLVVQNVTDARWKEGEFNYASHFDRAAPRSMLPQLHFSPGPPLGARVGVTLWL